VFGRRIEIETHKAANEMTQCGYTQIGLNRLIRLDQPEFCRASMLGGVMNIAVATMVSPALYDCTTGCTASRAAC